MSAAILLRTARQNAGLSQAQLARRAGMPRSVVNAYEHGSRDPGTRALLRLLAAAGAELQLQAPAPVDVERAGRILAQVLDLADRLPTRRRGPLCFPPLAPSA
jgi:transcriptional regulator with XRE-family HTH domain